MTVPGRGQGPEPPSSPRHPNHSGTLPECQGAGILRGLQNAFPAMAEGFHPLASLPPKPSLRRLQVMGALACFLASVIHEFLIVEMRPWVNMSRGPRDVNMTYETGPIRATFTANRPKSILEWDAEFREVMRYPMTSGDVETLRPSAAGGKPLVFALETLLIELPVASCPSDVLIRDHDKVRVAVEPGDDMTRGIGYGVFEPTNATLFTTFDCVFYVVVNVSPSTVGVCKVGVCLYPLIPWRPYNQGLCHEGSVYLSLGLEVVPHSRGAHHVQKPGGDAYQSAVALVRESFKEIGLVSSDFG